jgi:hypothetical protein
VETIKKMKHLKHLGVEKRVTLKYMLVGAELWNGFNQLRISFNETQVSLRQGPLDQPRDYPCFKEHPLLSSWLVILTE